MPSRTTVLGLLALVLLSGCSTFSGGSGAPTTTEAPPDHHEVVFATSLNVSEATVTVSNGETTVYEGSVSGGANGTYRRLTTLDEPGPYVVTVNVTDLVGDTDEHRQFQIDGDLGNATVVRARYSGLDRVTFSLPRRSLDHPLAATSRIVGPDASAVVLDVRVWHRDRRVASTSTTLGKGEDAVRVVDLAETGVYRVTARTTDGWKRDTVVVTDPNETVRVIVDGRGVNDVRTWEPIRWGKRR